MRLDDQEVKFNVFSVLKSLEGIETCQALDVRELIHEYGTIASKRMAR